MSGTFGEMGNLLKQAQQMQRELDRAREEIARARVEGSAGGGAVKVEVSGEGMVLKVHVKPELAATGDAAQIEETVLAALRDGLTRAATLRQERMNKVTGGISLPGIM